MGKANIGVVTSTARLGRILARLRIDGEVRASDLADEFRVSLMTVWRDIQRLAEQGLLKRIHGGACAVHAHGLETVFESKAVERSMEKKRIARAAIQRFVSPGEVVVLEGGTTVAALVDHLPDQQISIITNSLPIAFRIREARPALPVRMLGGWLSGVSGNTVGPETVASARTATSTICFLGATGWMAGHGPMDPNPLEIEVKRALAASSSRVVLLLDSRKFTIPSASVMIHPRRLHAVVTDSSPPSAVRRDMEKHGVECIVAGVHGAPAQPAC